MGQLGRRGGAERSPAPSPWGCGMQTAVQAPHQVGGSCVAALANPQPTTRWPCAQRRLGLGFLGWKPPAHTSRGCAVTARRRLRARLVPHSGAQNRVSPLSSPLPKAELSFSEALDESGRSASVRACVRGGPEPQGRAVGSWGARGLLRYGPSLSGAPGPPNQLPGGSEDPEPGTVPCHLAQPSAQRPLHPAVPGACV